LQYLKESMQPVGVIRIRAGPRERTREQLAHVCDAAQYDVAHRLGALNVDIHWFTP
jgi:hypothetical protein